MQLLVQLLTQQLTYYLAKPIIFTENGLKNDP